MQPITFVVPGRPLTWARASRGRFGQSYTPHDRECKMSEVRDAWNSLGLPPFAKDIDLALGLRIFCKRPDSHYRTNGLLKDWAVNARPKSGSNGGDVSNFVKLIEDALNSVAYHDDTQIAEYLPPFGKWYAAPQEMPRTEITLALAEPVTFSPVVDDAAEQLALAP